VIFIKKLNAHELGYRNGVSREAGRFLYITKDTTSFFPTLSPTIPHDSINVIINGISCAYTYHNSKHSSADPFETRDEHRIYVNRSLQAVIPFSPHDIIILEEISTANFNLHYIQTTDPYYPAAVAILNTSPRKTAKLVSPTSISGIIPGITGLSTALPLPLSSLTPIIPSPIPPQTTPTGSSGTRTRSFDIPSSTELNDAFAGTVQETRVMRTISETESIARDRIFRKVLLYLYEYNCAVTEKNINFGGFSNLEAAHIIPKEHGGGDHPTNGIVLNRDLHWAFDKGFFTIDDSYRINVHEELLEASSSIQEIQELEIHLPIDSDAYPDKAALIWHKENVFGRFLRI